MAKTTIYEKDVTTTPAKSATTNAVYVPGYAITGPIDTPIMCNSYEEFVNTFGDEPYIFTETQEYKAGTNLPKVQKGDPEKSYLYAKELLFAGIPVLYERVSTGVMSAAYKYVNLHVPILTSKNVVEQRIDSVAGQEIALNYEQVDGKYVYRVPDEYRFLFDGGCTYYATDFVAEVQDTIGSVTYKLTQTSVESGVGNITVTNAATEETISNITCTFDDGILVITSDEELATQLTSVQFTYKNTVYYFVYGNPYAAYNVWTLGLYTVDSRGREVTYEGIDSSKKHPDNFYYDTNKKSLSFSVPFTSFVVDFPRDFKKYYGSQDSEFSLDFVAKYPGRYGSNIKIETTTKTVKGISYINVNASLGEITENKLISLDRNSNIYYKNVEFDLINIYVTYNTVAEEPSQDFVEDSGYYLPDNSFSLEFPISETEPEFKLFNFYNKLLDDTDSIFNKLVDRNNYPIKYISSGAYPTYQVPSANIVQEDMYIPTYKESEIAERMMKVAGDRTDAVALIDCLDNFGELSLEELYENLQDLPTNYTQLNELTAKYAQMTIGAGKYKLRTYDSVITLPGSFAYLRCLAESSKTNPNYYAIAGVTRGLVPSFIEPVVNITGAEADLCQARTGVSINPITKINPYGYTIWGNRTLYPNVDGLVASSFLNIRVLCADIKKEIFKITQGLSFELYTDILWVNFKSALQSVLDKIKTNGGIRSYNIKQVSTNSRATIKALVTITPVEAVEDFDITLELADGYVNIQ